jgi:hypothetical protein
MQLKDDEQPPETAVAVMEWVQRLERVVRHRRRHHWVDVWTVVGLHPGREIAQACLQVRARRRWNVPGCQDGGLLRTRSVPTTDDHLDRPNAGVLALACGPLQQQSLQFRDGGDGPGPSLLAPGEGLLGNEHVLSTSRIEGS